MSDAPLQLLLLEDSDSDALRIRTLLDQSPSQTVELTRVDRVSDALKILDRQAFDLLLLDLCVHDSQGIETFERIHSHAQHLPIIVQSGLNEDSVGGLSFNPTIIVIIIYNNPVSSQQNG